MYTQPMAYDVRAVAASLDAELFLGGVDAGVPVNEAILLEQLVVGSAPGFASAVVGSPMPLPTHWPTRRCQRTWLPAWRWSPRRPPVRG